MFLRPAERIIIPCDVSTEAELIEILEELGPYGVLFKIGKQLFHSIGTPRAIELVRQYGGRIFLDAKLKDITKTVQQATEAICSQGVQMVNVHGTMRVETLRAFAATCRKHDTISLAVTVLTDHTDEDCEEIYGACEVEGGNPVEIKVLQTAETCLNAGMNGIICSPMELKFLMSCDTIRERREETGVTFVIPGIRPEWSVADGQTRFTKPAEAIRDGADYLVIGSPIVKAAQYGMTRAQALERIIEEIEGPVIERLFAELGIVMRGGHYAYTSGKHGEAYVDKDILFEYPELSDWLASVMARRIRRRNLQVDHVIGPAYGAISLAQLVGKHLGVRPFYAKKDEKTDGVKMKQGWRDAIRGKSVVVVEDIVNTGKTILQVIELVRECGGHVEGIVALYNRDVQSADTLGIPSFLPLINNRLPIYPPGKGSCPLCDEDRPINTDLGHGQAYVDSLE